MGHPLLTEALVGTIRVGTVDTVVTADIPQTVVGNV